MKSDKVILLTACISPSKIENLKLTSASERLEQYKNALTFYLQSTTLPICFVDNSNIDLSSDFKFYIESGRIECHTFDGSNHSLQKGKGYGEAQIINYALKNSKLLSNAEYIVKVTGRLIISNINQLINYAEIKVSKNANSLFFDIDLNLTYAQTQFFIASKYFLVNFFIPNIEQINDSTDSHFESIIARSIRKWTHKNKLFLFPNPIMIVGVSGSTGKIYTMNSINLKLRKILKFILFSINDQLKIKKT